MPAGAGLALAERVGVIEIDLPDGVWVRVDNSVNEGWSAWLEQTGNEADLLRALPAGSLTAEQVR
jgi:hypothetical protein